MATQNIKEMPRRVAGFPVVKGVFLGWLNQYGQESGYTCFVITYGRDGLDESAEFRAHVLRATGLDKPWRTFETREKLSNGQANKLFYDHEKLAAWPERS